jgi:hypothetical protein
MTKRRLGKRARLIGSALLICIVAFAAYGFTAGNSVPGTSAGSGSGTISGYTVTSVVYGLNATTPTNIDSVSFTVSPAAASTVKIQLATGGSWYTCSNTAGAVTCATTSPQATVLPSDNLTVVAVQ